MSERCVDASVIVKLALKGERYRAKARRLVHESAREGINLIAPPFFISEVDTAIRKRVHDGKLSEEDALKAYSVLDRAPIQIATHQQLRQRAREIAEQSISVQFTMRPTLRLRNCAAVSSGQRTRCFMMM